MWVAGNGEDDPEVAAFLRGEASSVDTIRGAVRLVVRGFQLTGGGIDSELVQETLSRIFLNLTTGRFRGASSLKTYACKVARYACLEHLRRRRHESDIDIESIPSRARWSGPEESFLWSEEHLRNLQTFASLPSDAQDLLRLVFVEGLSYRDVSSRLGISQGAVRLRVHRCRVALRAAAMTQARRSRPPARRTGK